MSPHLSPYMFTRPGSIRALLFVIIALPLGLLFGSSAAKAQSNSPSGSWQAVRKGPVSNGVPPRASEAAPSQDGWHARPAAKSAVQPVAHQEPVVEAEEESADSEISADAAFGDHPQPQKSKAARKLEWQPQSAPASSAIMSSARRYPAETRTAAVRSEKPQAERKVVRTDYEFEDPPAGVRSRTTAGTHSNLEPIAAPEPIKTPKPMPADSGMTYDDPSEIISDGEIEGEDVLGDACDCCDDCGHCNCFRCCRPFAGKLWVRGEYLLWWSPGYSVPALITTSTGSTLSTAGQLGQPGTNILFGKDRLATETRSGLRITAGYLLMPCRDVSIEGSYTTTGTLSDSFSTNSNAFPVIARPFFNILSDSQGQAAHITAFPGEATGSISVMASSEFNSAEAYLRKKMCDEHNYHIDFLAGYRYARLDEKLGIIENQSIIGQRLAFPAGTVLSISDNFNTLNEFNGGQIGFVFQEQYRRWSVEMTAKLAVGNTRTQTLINGSTTQTGVGGVPNATLTYAGGVLAQPSNSGLTEINSVTVMPEFGLTLSYNLNRRIKLSAGYNFLYWSKIARPGDQIDANINSSQVPPATLNGAAFPQAPNRTTDFLLQGVTAGLEYRF